jgi:replicative DNA helicase
MSGGMSDAPTPADLPSEMGALGACFFDEKAAAYVIDTLTENDFHWKGNRTIFGVIHGLVLNDRQPAELLERVECKLSDSGRLDEVGGRAYLARLMDCGVPWDAATLQYRCRRITSATTRRKLLEALGSAVNEVREGRSVEGETLDGEQLQDRTIAAVLAATRLARKRTGSTIKEALFRQSERMERTEIIPAMPIGITALDARSGGLRPGELGLMCGRPGMGKSALGLMQAYHSANHWGPGLLLSLEMDEDALAIRLVASRTGFSFRELADVAVWNGSAFETMADADVQKAVSAAVSLAQTQHEIYVETDAHELSRIQSLVQRHRLEHGITWLLVDYGQLVRDDSRKSSSRAEEMARIARTFKQLASAHKIPVWVLAQPSRDVEKRQTRGGKPDRLRMSDLGWSGEWEAAANVIWFINPDPDWNDDGLDQQHVILEIGKSRNGPKGDVPLVFQKRAFRFGERDDRHEEHRPDPDARAGY